MRLLFSLFVILVQLRAVAADKQWTAISSEVPVPVTCRVVSQTGGETVLFIRVEGFETREVVTSRGPAVVISCPGMVPMLKSGDPDLPSVVFPLIVPEGIEMKAELISSAFQEFTPISLAPSKGNLYRNQDPEKVPYSYSSAYDRSSYYPTELLELRPPFVLRDFTGQALCYRPFSYDPSGKRLRVCVAATVRIRPADPNLTARVRLPEKVDETFAGIYSERFVNYSSFDYSPLSDQGSMLIIAESSFINQLKPFVEWKKRTGIPTELADLNTIGRSSQALKSYVADYYRSHGLTFLLLVGDDSQLPPFSSPSGYSDPSYGYIDGNDSYAEVIVGRFSANDSMELATQIERTLRYEGCSDTDAVWFGRGVCIASNQGPGDDNEFDYEHARNMRQDLLSYSYSVVDELYDGTHGVADAPGSPVPFDLIQVMNEGRGVVTYTGHGSSAGFLTTGFGLSDISALQNKDRLPFIWSVACVNGEFVGGTCLAEGLMRATDPQGAPVGAVACLMSTINQSWDPPMDGQDEMVDLLTKQYPDNVKRTFGGISVNGCMHMNDQYGAAGFEITDTWTCFGDPSLRLRTTAPRTLSITHPPFLTEGADGLIGTCSWDGACLSLFRKDTLFASDFSAAGGFGFAFEGLLAGDTLELTATALNAVPYTARIPVRALSSPKVSLSVYPNPARESVRIGGVEFDQQAVLGLYDACGRLVLQSSVPASTAYFDLPLSGLPTGCYQLVVSAADVINHCKLMIR
jgi:hypothetical protein